MKANQLTALLLDAIGYDSIEEVTAVATNVITSDKQFDVAYVSMFKKPTVKVVNVEIGYDNYKKQPKINKLLLSSEAESRTRVFSDMNITSKIKIRRKNKITVARDFTFDLIEFKLDHKVKAIKDFSKYFFASTITVVYDKETGWLRVFSSFGCKNGRVMNLEDGKYYDLKALNLNTMRYKVVEYKYDPSTASGKRNDSGMFESIALCDNRFERFDKASGGALGIMFNDVVKKNDKIVSAEDARELKLKILKKEGYIGNVSTAGIATGITRGFHIFHGEWLNTTPEGFFSKKYADLLVEIKRAEKEGLSEEVAKLEEAMKLEEAKKLEDVSTSDGVFFVNSVEWCKNMWLKHKIFIAPEVIVGRTGQARPASCKGLAWFCGPDMYRAIISGTEKLANNLNSRHVNDNSWNKMELKKYGTDESLFIADNNVVKMEFDYNSDFEFYLLNFSKHSTSDSSGQLMRNAFYAAKLKGDDKLKELTNYIIKIQQLIIDSELADTIDADREAASITPDNVIDAIEGGYIINDMLKIGPKCLGEFKAVVDRACLQKINALVGDIDKMKVGLNVVNRKFVPDPTFIITGGKVSGLLELGECYISSNKVDDLTMFKYPISGLLEQMSMTNKHLNPIINMVSELYDIGIIDNVMADGLIEAFGALRDTNILLPSFVFITLACAGSDFDGDSGACINKVKEPQDLSEEFTNYVCELFDGMEARGVWIDI